MASLLTATTPMWCVCAPNYIFVQVSGPKQVWVFQKSSNIFLYPPYIHVYLHAYTQALSCAFEFPSSFLMFYSVYVCSSVFSLSTGCFVYLMVIFSGLVVLAVLYALYILHVWEAYV